MRASTTLLLLLSFLISLAFPSGIVGSTSNVVFYIDGNTLYVSSASTGSVLRSLQLAEPTKALMDEDSIYILELSQVSVYSSSSAPELQTSISPGDKVIDFTIDGEGRILVIAQEGNSYKLYLYDKVGETGQTTFNLEGTLEIEGDTPTIYDGDTPLISTSEGVYVYYLGSLKKISGPTPLASGIVSSQTNNAYLEQDGRIVFLSNSFDVLSSYSVDGGAYLYFDGGFYRVLSSSGKIYSFSVSNLSLARIDRGRDMNPIASSFFSGKLAVVFNDVVVFSSNGKFIDRRKIDGYARDVKMVSGKVYVLTYKDYLPKLLVVRADKGCYFTSFEDEVGYVKFNITGRVWPPTSRQLSILVGEKVFQLNSDDQGEFSLKINPKELPFGEQEVVCLLDGSRHDSFLLNRKQDLPKDTFSVSPMPSKVSKGEKISFEVRDSTGDPVERFSVVVNGRAFEGQAGSFSYVFEDQGTYDVRIFAEGFEELTFRVEVPGLPIVPIAVGAVIILAVGIYYVLSVMK